MGEVIENPQEIDVSRPTVPHTLIEPLQFLKGPHERTALIILNQPIHEINLHQLWQNSEVHICADGGANQLYRFFGDLKDRYIPEFIVGDFDSLEEKVRQYYENKGTVVIQQTTQYASDYMKAIDIAQLYYYSEDSKRSLNEDIDTHDGLSQAVKKHINEDTSASNNSPVYAYLIGGVGGRFDQTIQSINQLYYLNETVPFVHQYLITSEDVIFLVPKGHNYISFPAKHKFHNSAMPICGLLPLGSKPVVLNTVGLRYDVVDWESSMGGNVSSSNAVSGRTGVVIDTTDSIVINIEVDHRVT